MTASSLGTERGHFAAALAAALLLEAALIAAVMLLPFPEREVPPPQHPARMRVHFAPVTPPAPPKPVAPPPVPVPQATPQPPPPQPLPPRITRPTPAAHHAPAPHARHRNRPRPAAPAPVMPAPVAAARPAAPAAPAAPPPEDFAAEEIRAYAEALAARVKAAIEDPPSVRRGEASGTAHMAVTVSPDGRLLRAVLVRSSGNADIDQATVAGVRAVVPPPYTAHMPRQPETFTLGIHEGDD